MQTHYEKGTRLRIYSKKHAEAGIDLIVERHMGSNVVITPDDQTYDLDGYIVLVIE